MTIWGMLDHWRHLRALAISSLIGLAALSGGATAPAEEVKITGDKVAANLVLSFIRLAEEGNENEFRRMIGPSVVKDGGPALERPSMDAVDRRDEGCSLRSIDAWLPHMVEAIWRCTNDTKPNVERMFLIEEGRVTLMSNDWVVHPLPYTPSLSCALA
jgi:hypothetical protein